MKRFFMTVCSVVLLGLCLIAVSENAYAASLDDLTYELFANQIIITGCDPSASGAIDIPREIDGYLVTTIGSDAFSGCVNLTSVTIPDSVMVINENAFYNCSSLTNIYYNAVNVTDFPESNNVFYNAGQSGSGIKLTIGAKVKRIPAHLFNPCRSASYAPNTVEIKFESGSLCESIGEYAFSNNRNLKNVAIPYGVKILEKYAFHYCMGLTDVSIPNSVTTIGDYAFYSCSSLTSITIPGSVTVMGNFVFYYCDGLISAIICDGVSYIGSYAFYNCTGLTWIVIPDSVTTINSQAFRYAEVLTDVLYTGTEEQWNSITIGSLNSDLVYADKHFGVYWTQNCENSGWFCPDCSGFIVKENAEDGAHTYLQGICAVCGLGEYPFSGYVNGTYFGYYELESAIAAGDLVKLFTDGQIHVTLTRDLYIDLNGHNLSGTVTTNGHKIYGMDSTTDSYYCVAFGYMNLVNENGEAIVPMSHFKSDITGSVKRYMAIQDDNGYSFHRFYLGITHQSLKPTTVGVGYKAVFYGDDMVISNLDSYGFTMQLGAYSPKTVSVSGGFVSGKTVTLRIDNYDVEAYGETELNAAVMLKLTDGTVIESGFCTMTLRSMLEALNESYTALSDEQRALVAEFIKKHAIISSWKVENLI